MVVHSKSIFLFNCFFISIKTAEWCVNCSAVPPAMFKTKDWYHAFFFFLSSQTSTKLINKHTYANKYDLDYYCIIFCFKLQFAVEPTRFRNVFCPLTCNFWKPVYHSRSNITKQHKFLSMETFICINISCFIGSSNLDLPHEDSRLDRRAVSEAVYLYISCGHWDIDFNSSRSSEVGEMHGSSSGTYQSHSIFPYLLKAASC